MSASQELGESFNRITDALKEMLEPNTPIGNTYFYVACFLTSILAILDYTNILDTDVMMVLPILIPLFVRGGTFLLTIAVLVMVLAIVLIVLGVIELGKILLGLITEFKNRKAKAETKQQQRTATANAAGTI